jgi:hypothetical protein
MEGNHFNKKAEKNTHQKKMNVMRKKMKFVVTSIFFLEEEENLTRKSKKNAQTSKNFRYNFFLPFIYDENSIKAQI